MENVANKNKSDAGNYRLADLVDLSLLQKMVEAHYRAAGMPMGIIDAYDNSVLVGAGWQDICLKFHRANPVSRKRCEASDSYIKGHLTEGKTCAYKCANGLWDIGIPIIVKGQHLATIFLGQFFYEGETPDRKFFQRQAIEFGYDISGYLAALDRVPVFSHEKVDYLLAYDKALADFIADLAEQAMQRIKSDRELRYANAVLTAQQENSPDGILVVDSEQKMISFNKKFIEMWHMPDEVVKTRLNEKALQAALRLVANPDEFITKTKNMYEHRDQRTFEEIRLKDGRIFERYSSPMFRPDGTYYGRLLHFRDITERKKADEALLESEQRFSAFFKLSPVIMLISALDDGRIYEVNEAFEKLFGIPKDKALGHTTIEIGMYRNAEERKKLVRAVLERGTVYDLELVLKNSNGRTISALVSSTCLHFRGRSYLFTSGMDITERKKAEEALRESERRFTTFFKLSPVAMLISSFDDGRIYGVNEAFEKLFGIPRDKAIGHTTYEIGIYGNAEDREKLVRAVKEQGTVHDLDLTLKNRDGSTIEALLSSTRLYLGQKPYLFTAVMNITERKQAEKVLQKSYEEVEKSLEGVINAITMIVEIRDPYTAGHQKRVSRLAAAIAEEMGLPRDRIEVIRIASILHDIGKIYVPAEILAKPGKLSHVEMDIVKTHPRASFDILKMINFPWPVADIAYQHQERYNGTGYPRGLSDGDILPEARILAVADTIEAMTIRRPYRSAVGIDEALDSIVKDKGIAYDPKVVDATIRLFRDKRFTFEPEEERNEKVLAK